MQLWQKILHEETLSKDFQLVENNDNYIIDAVIKSYKTQITASFSQVKEILDGAYASGFKLVRRRYPSKTVFALSKSFGRANLVIQFSIQPKTLFVCEVVYGSNNSYEDYTAPRSKYFPVAYNKFDKTLPLYFLDVSDIDKSELKEEYAITVQDEYDWSEFLEYVYSFMVVMIENLQEESIEDQIDISTSITESIEQNPVLNTVDAFINELTAFNENISILKNHNEIKNEIVIYIKLNVYDSISDEDKNRLNTIISNFNDIIIPSSIDVTIDKSRSKLSFERTIFIKYI